MMSSLKIGRIRGIRITVHPTWFLAVVFIAWTIESLFARSYPGWSPSQLWTAAVLGALALFGSVLLHELAHSITAQQLGLKVDGITLFIFGGASQIRGRYERARDEFLVAFAGPLMSLLLGVLCLVAWQVFRPDDGDPVLLLGLIFYLGVMNLLLGAFNLLPGFPLDGGRVFRSMIWGWTKNESLATRLAANVGQLLAWAMFGLGIYRFVNGDIMGGIWMAFIGMFLQSAARSERRSSLVDAAGPPIPLRAAIQRTPRVADARERLSDVMEGIIAHGDQSVVPVIENGTPIGFFTAADAARFPAVDWHNLSVGSAVVRQPLLVVQATDNAVDVLEALRARNISYAMVFTGNEFVGVASREAIEATIRFMTPDDGASPESPRA
jgi:Zn-dependent protease/CBS domain-containing protein